MRSRRTVTGIDVGNHAVKLVRLEGGETGQATLTHWGVEGYPLSGSASVEERAQALDRLLRRLRLRPRSLGRVATAVGGRGVHVRQVVMPMLSPDELRRALPYEARKHLPLENVTDPCLDFQILGEIGANGSGPASRQRVLLVAAPRAGRDEVLEALESTGIQPEVIDAQPLPVVNAILSAHPPAENEGAVIVDLGATVSVLAAVLPEHGLYSRPLDFTGEAITKAVEGDLAPDRARAEEVKRQLPGPDWATSAPPVETQVRDLIRELQETLRFLRVRERTSRVSKIYLCGGSALLPALDERLRSALGIEVEYADPFQRTKASKAGLPSIEDRVGLVGALGLAAWWE